MRKGPFLIIQSKNFRILPRPILNESHKANTSTQNDEISFFSLIKMAYCIISFWNLVVILEVVIVHATRSITIDSYVKRTQKIEKTKKKIFFR